MTSAARSICFPGPRGAMLASDPEAEGSMSSTILIVEDNEDIGENLVEILRDEGYEPWLARTADDALVLLEHAPAPPTLILLDLVMPGMPALEFVGRLKGSSRWAAIPVVLITAAAPPEGLAVSGVLRKPFDVRDLIGRMHELAPLPSVREDLDPGH